MTFTLETFQMKLDGLLDKMQDLFAAFSRGNAAGKIRDISPKARWAFLYDDHVAHNTTYFFRPACFRALLSVPCGTSMLGLPETVTVPGLVG